MTKLQIDRPDAETPRNGNGGPWYAQVIRTILNTSGPVALIALVLLWFLMYAVTGQLATLQQGVAGAHEEIQAAKVTMHAFAERQLVAEERREMQQELQLRLLRQLCVNSAKTESAMRACLGER